MNRIPVVAYGAVAQVPPPASSLTNIRKRLRQGWDRLGYRWGVETAIDYRNHIDSGTYNRGDFAIMQASVQALGHANSQLHLLPTDWEALDSVDAKIRAMVICGSGYFFLDAQLRFTKRLHDDLVFIKARRVPVIVYGAGVNLVDAHLTQRAPQLPEEQKAFLSEFLVHCANLSVRDETSRSILQSCTSNTVKLIGDPALFIEANRQGRPLSTLAARPRIGINIPFHGPAASQRIASDLPAYIATLKRIQAETDCQFYLMVHFDTEVMIAQFLQDAGVQISVVHGDVDTLLGIYGQLDLHIGGMLHSCILSASTGTPCIGLAYDIKHAGFFDLMGISEYCIPALPFDPDSIVRMTHTILAEAAGLRESILLRRSELATEASIFLREALAQVGVEAT